jgi:hypothetical protein
MEAKTSQLADDVQTLYDRRFPFDGYSSFIYVLIRFALFITNCVLSESNDRDRADCACRDLLPVTRS